MSPVRFHKCAAEHCTRMIEMNYKYCSIECGAYSGYFKKNGTRLNKRIVSKRARGWHIVIDDGYVSVKYKLNGISDRISISDLYTMIQKSVRTQIVLKEL